MINKILAKDFQLPENILGYNIYELIPSSSVYYEDELGILFIDKLKYTLNREIKFKDNYRYGLLCNINKTTNVLAGLDNFLDGYLIYNGNSWAKTSNIDGYFGGVGGDITGSFPIDIQAINISNITNGFLDVKNGGLYNYINNINDNSLLYCDTTSSISNIDTSNLDNTKVYLLKSNYDSWIFEENQDLKDYFDNSNTKFEYTSPGEYVWTKPSVYHRNAKIFMHGAGGGGGGFLNNVVSSQLGYGGGAGGVSIFEIDISNITNINISIGEGGNGGNITNPTGSNGGDTIVSLQIEGENISFVCNGGIGGRNGGFSSVGNPSYPYGGFGMEFNGGRGGDNVYNGSYQQYYSSSGSSGGSRSLTIPGAAGKYENIIITKPYGIDTDVYYAYGGLQGSGNGARGNDGIYGSGGGICGAVTSLTNVGDRTGGKGGDGFVIIISY
jgi:hypothetical protein